MLALSLDFYFSLAEFWFYYFESRSAIIDATTTTMTFLRVPVAFSFSAAAPLHREFAPKFSRCNLRSRALGGTDFSCGRTATSAFPATMSASVTNSPRIERLNPGARFNQIVLHNGICYLSGQVFRGAKDDAAAQTRGILAKIDTLLEEAGTSKSNLLSCTIWLAEIERDVAMMNAEWDKWVDKENMPVRACVESKLVDREITVEIQATAALPERPRSSVISTTEAAAAVGPYNQAVRMRDGTVYISGCIGLTTAGDFRGPSVEEQTKQCLANLAAILKASGTNGQIVKTTILLDDMNDFAAVNKLYEDFFSPGGAAAGPVPARACFSAKTLPKGALVEIEAIAVVEC